MSEAEVEAIEELDDGQDAAPVEEPIDDASPEDDSDEEAEEELYPFYRVTGMPGRGTRAAAGWLNGDGEVVQTVIDTSGLGVARAEQAVLLALGWYADTLQAIHQPTENNE